MKKVNNIFEKDGKFFRLKPLEPVYYCQPSKPEEEPALEEIEIIAIVGKDYKRTKIDRTKKGKR